ncbi:MAG TPA: hypothetical protein VGE21_09450 [Flavobacteriales bacterium]
MKSKRPSTAPPKSIRDVDGLLVQVTVMPDDLLLLLRARLEEEMRKRKIAFSVGAVGEGLVISHFKGTPGLPNLQLAPTGTKNVDALSRNGDRYSIKTICNAKKTGTIYPDALDKDRQLFEYLIIARLTADWSLHSIHQFSWSAFLEVRSWDKRMNAWYVAISERAMAKATRILPVE